MMRDSKQSVETPYTTRLSRQAPEYIVAPTLHVGQHGDKSGIERAPVKRHGLAS